MFGNPIYVRIDVPATVKQQAVLNQLSPHQIATPTLAGDAILAKLIEAPGNKVPIGGIKVVTENGWFAVRPSGTEKVYKIYTESFTGREHLVQIQGEAKAMIGAAFLPRTGKDHGRHHDGSVSVLPGVEFSFRTSVCLQDKSFQQPISLLQHGGCFSCPGRRGLSPCPPVGFQNRAPEGSGLGPDRTYRPYGGGCR